MSRDLRIVVTVLVAISLTGVNVASADENTPGGRHISVDFPIDSVMIIFDSVAQGGVTEVFASVCAIAVSPSYRVVPISGPRCWNITTTAVYVDSIEVCITFDEAWLHAAEESVSMRRLDSVGLHYPKTGLDTSANTLCGTSSELSLFVLVQPCCLLRGDANGDGTIDVSDLTSLVAFIFLGGSTGPCPEEMDLNADGGTSISDLTYLVVYLFQDGPIPPGCDASVAP
jgi:hypothetical protein